MTGVLYNVSVTVRFVRYGHTCLPACQKLDLRTTKVLASISVFAVTPVSFRSAPCYKLGSLRKGASEEATRQARRRSPGIHLLFHRQHLLFLRHTGDARRDPRRGNACHGDCFRFRRPGGRGPTGRQVIAPVFTGLARVCLPLSRDVALPQELKHNCTK